MNPYHKIAALGEKSHMKMVENTALQFYLEADKIAC